MEEQQDTPHRLVAAPLQLLERSCDHFSEGQATVDYGADEFRVVERDEAAASQEVRVEELFGRGHAWTRLLELAPISATARTGQRGSWGDPHASRSTSCPASPS